METRVLWFSGVSSRTAQSSTFARLVRARRQFFFVMLVFSYFIAFLCALGGVREGPRGGTFSAGALRHVFVRSFALLVQLRHRLLNRVLEKSVQFSAPVLGTE